MKINLKCPANWQEFQDLCFQLWKELWRDPASHQNGRIGQPQHGVDIWGINLFDKDYSGVQCKGKNGNYNSVLSAKEIDDECKKATHFTPKLKSFVMATTSPRDATVQEHCRDINNKGIYPFSVDTWSWDDIEDEIQCRPSLMEKFYPNVKEMSLLKEIKIPVFAANDKLHAFFSRPGLFNKLTPQALIILRDLAYEIANNAFDHGRAGTFAIKVEDNKIIFSDNGIQFDYSTLINKGNGGKDTMKYAVDFFDISYRYEKENTLELTMRNGQSVSDVKTCFTIYFNAIEIFGRGQTQRLIESEFNKIPSYCDKLIVDIGGNINPAISCSYAVFDKLIQLLRADQQAIIYLPHDLYYKEDILQRYSHYANMSIKFKE